MNLAKVINADEIFAYHKVWSTKEFFSFDYNKRRFLDDEHWEYTELVENIKDGKVAVFPISTDVRMEEVINTNKLGLQVYLLQYREWKELKEKYIADAVEGLEDTERH